MENSPRQKNSTAASALAADDSRAADRHWRRLCFSTSPAAATRALMMPTLVPPPFRSVRTSPGRVIEVDVRDNEVIERGATLFKLDDAPFRIAVDDAKARLASTRLQVESLKSTYKQRQVQLRAARDTQAFAQTQFDRQSRLVASGISSRTQFDQASHSLDAARQEVANMQQQIGVALANLGGNPRHRTREASAGRRSAGSA